MKKYLSKPLVITNIIVIVILLVASTAMIITTNTKNGNLFNYEAKLVVSKNGEKIDNKIGDKCLVITKLENINNFKNGDYILYEIEENLSISKIDSVNSNSITYIDKNGKKQTLDIDLKKQHPKITLSSNFLGTIIYSIAGKENVSLTYILIVGIFIISMLSLAIIYTSHMKKILLSKKKEKQSNKETDLSNSDNSTPEDEKPHLQYVFEESKVDLSINEENETKDIDKKETLSCKMLSNTNTDNSKVDEPTFSQDNVKNDDTPSIDSLIEEIDTLDCK